jgi:hypothetical protein
MRKWTCENYLLMIAELAPADDMPSAAKKKRVRRTAIDLSWIFIEGLLYWVVNSGTKARKLIHLLLRNSSGLKVLFPLR